MTHTDLMALYAMLTLLAITLAVMAADYLATGVLN